MIKRIGVIGAGQMGSGIAHVCALKGYDIRLVDVDQAHLDAGLDNIGRNMDRQIGRGMIRPEDKDAGLKHISTATDYKVFADCDLIVEAATENEAIKREIFKKVCVGLPPNVLLATNTSSISVTRLASVTDRPGKFMGMHFMNPVPLKTAVEVIRGYHTSDETLDTAKGLLAKMGKEAIVVNDSPGFVSNRVLMLTVNEAIFLVQDGVATAEQIDHLFKSCFGHKMGPLETADLIGLDTILYSIEVLHEAFDDSKYRPCPLLKKMVDAGLHGRKSGKGFYDYGIAP